VKCFTKMQVNVKNIQKTIYIEVGPVNEKTIFITR